MELSKYVLSILHRIVSDNITEKYKIAELFQNAERVATLPADIDILRIVSGALSMWYSSEKDTYCPMIILDNGTKTFSMEDVDEQATIVLASVLSGVDTSWLRAKIADILWLKTKNYKYGEVVVIESLNLFDQTFDQNRWTSCIHAIERANAVSISLGKNTLLYKAVYDKAFSSICSINGMDPLFLSLMLIRMIYRNASGEDLKILLCIAQKITEKNMKTENTNLVEDTFSVLRLLLKKLEKNDDLDAAELQLATWYENRADKQEAIDDNGLYQALFDLQKAFIIYKTKKDIESIIRVRKRIKKLQAAILLDIPSVSHEFDATPIYISVKQLFEGLSVQEMIVQLGRMAIIHNVEDVKKQVLDNQKEYISNSIFQKRIIDESGHTIEIIPPLQFEDPQEDESTFFKHMIHYVTQRRLLDEAVTLKYAFEILQSYFPFPASTFDFLTKNNAIIPKGRADIVKAGLYLAFSGELCAAMYILLPQVEHIFRYIVLLCEDTITYLNDDGTEEYKSLSQLFKSDKLRECYDENIIFSFQSIMDEKAGLNFRNLAAHGLLDLGRGNSGAALCFICLVIRLLSLYSMPAYKILKDIRILDQKQNDTSNQSV